MPTDTQTKYIIQEYMLDIWFDIDSSTSKKNGMRLLKEREDFQNGRKYRLVKRTQQQVYP